MDSYRFIVLITIFLLGVPLRVGAEGNAQRGLAIYQNKCATCHSIDYNGVGPAHRGLFGRKAGTQADFNYSDALKGVNFIWDEKKLNQWLTNPEKMVPGQKMGFSVASPKERADLIAYLKIATTKND